MNSNKKGEMGVGTLIIFIALLLVAAVAAGVLIQTAGTLQQRALSTGTQATGQIATNAQVIEVSAVDGTGNLENFSYITRLAPGSEAIEFESVTLTLNLNDQTQTFVFNESAAAEGTTTEFNVEYLQTGTNNQPGVLVRGDVVRVSFIASRAVGSGEDVRITFIPKTGTPTLTMFTVPDVISTQRVYLYP